MTPPSLLLLIVAATLVMICDYHHRRAKYNTWKKAELAAVSPCSSPGPGHTAADYRQVADIFTHAHKYFYLPTINHCVQCGSLTDVSLVSECGDYTPLIADPGPGIYR